MREVTDIDQGKQYKGEGQRACLGLVCPLLTVYMACQTSKHIAGERVD